MPRSKGNSSWALLSCNTKTIDERIFQHQLRSRDRFDFGSRHFSDRPVPIQFLAVFDRYAQNPEGMNYELIFGNDSGSGAFTFPNPGLILPYRLVADNIETGEEIDSKPTPEIDNLILNLLYSPRMPKDYEKEVSDDAGWLRVAGRIRPYSGLFMGSDKTRAVKSSHADIVGLKRVVERFSGRLMDSRLPERFRDGVSYIAKENPAAICSRYGIPARSR
jgi:hypothetical protein